MPTIRIAMRQGVAAGPEVVVDRQHSCSSTAFATFPDSALETSLVDRFSLQVAVHRDCVAVIDRGRELTYGELDGWSNGIAQAILDREGAGSEPLALVFAQGAASCAAILGALKAGRPYVSLDPTDPGRARTARAVGARAVLTDRARSTDGSLLARGRPLVVDDVEPAADPGVRPTGDSIAYVYFTSGTTGEPKGVYDSHRNVLHNVLRYSSSLGISPCDRLSLIQRPSFSACVSSLFSALLNGAALVPFSLDEAGIGDLPGWLREHRVSIYHSVPSIFRSVLRGDPDLPDLRVVRLEGDRASWRDVELHRRHLGHSLLVNGLGTTETGIARQLFVEPGRRVESGVLPVGYPVRDMEILVVGDDGHEVSPGHVGEIVVRSPYLALGYWNRPDLTDIAFSTEGGSRRYRTGDLGRLRPDGCLEYLGRKDGELKVLGHRVEPAEVEAEIARLHGVKEVAVTTREGSRGEARLVAYVVPETGRSPAESELRRALATRVPGHMVPSAVVSLDALPLGANGKVDRGALPDAVSPARGRPPRDDEERLVARVWEEVLAVGAIGVENDFLELGGDSLAAAEVLARLEAETGRPLPSSAIAGAATVAELAVVVRAAPTAGSSSLVVLRADGHGAPIVLLHGNTGGTRHYAALVRRLPDGYPLWALEDTLPSGDIDVAAVAARHVSTLEAARPTGPFVLAGFCYGAVLAHEIACQLRRRGRDVPVLALLGITPLEFPSLRATGAHERSRLVCGPGSFASRTRRHLARARSMPRREGLNYLSRRGVALLRRTLPLGRSRVEEPSGWSAIQASLAAHRPEPCPGRPLVVLHDDDSSEYTDDPERDWTGLGLEGVEVEVLPGGDHDMLEEPGVARLAALLDARLATRA